MLILFPGEYITIQRHRLKIEKVKRIGRVTKKDGLLSTSQVGRVSEVTADVSGRVVNVTVTYDRSTLKCPLPIHIL